MIEVTVIAPGGAKIASPARLRLSKAQHAARAAKLGPRARNGVCDLLCGDVQFKEGETFGIAPEGKLSRALFHWDEPDAEQAEEFVPEDDEAPELIEREEPSGGA